MSRTKKHEEHENHERWLVSYADFITLLFAFFVVLYATSNRNEEKEKEFQESIRNYMKMVSSAFGGSGGGGGPSGGVTGSLLEMGDGGKQHLAENSRIEKELNRIVDGRLAPQERKTLIPSIESEKDGVRLTLSSPSLFTRGSAKMKRDAIKAVAAISDVLKSMPYKIIVTGYTDEISNGNSQYESNWELAGAQAASVVRFLSKVHQVPEKKMAVVSYGNQKPIFENTTDEKMLLNRRIEIFISTKEEAEE